MRIGAHVSSAGGIERVFGRAQAIDAEAIQMFISAPQQWRPPNISDAQAEKFRALREESGLPVFLHAIYLINLGSPDETQLNRSTGALKQYLKWGGILGVEGVIFHVGSHRGAGFEAIIEQAASAMREALDYADNGCRLLMENNAGQGNGIGSSFAELGQLLAALDADSRVGVCLDTCHGFAMGYDLSTPDGCASAITEFDREIGLDRLAVVHANDSKMPLGGVRDRHENIGDGHIGYDGFRAILAEPAFADLTFLLEVPGIEGDGPDAENVRRLKAIRDEVGASPP